LERGQHSGFEALAALGMDGDVRGRATSMSDGNPRAVTFTPTMESILHDPKQKVVTFHNHPSSNAPSKGDNASAVAPGHHALVVTGHNGDWHGVQFVATPRDTTRASTDRATKAVQHAWTIAFNVAAKHVDPLFHNKVLDQKNAERTFWPTINRVLEAAGL